MKQIAAKFVSAIFATILASSTLTAAPDEEKAAPDTCLLGPSASTPPGGHWYYRVDRANKRNCWYLKQETEKVARKPAAEEDSALAEKPASAAPKKLVTQRSITDAHAELPLPQTPVEQDTQTVATKRTPAAQVDTPRTDNGQRTGTSDASKVVTTRWPEPATAAAPPAPPPPPAPVAKVAETPAQTPTQAAPAAPAPRPAAPPVPQQAAAAASSGKPALSLPMLLTVLVGGLSVVGVMASAIFARGKSQRRKSRPTRLSRSAPMPPLQAAERPLPPERPLPEEPRAPRAPDDPTQRLQHMLAEIQKRAAAA